MNQPPLPQIDPMRCTGCQRCVNTCPTQALDQKDGKAYLRYVERCTYCAACEEVCPENAIALPFLVVLADPKAGDESERNKPDFLEKPGL